MEPIEYVRIFRRRWKVVAACVLVAAAIAWVTAPNDHDPGAAKPEVYEARHTLIRESSATSVSSIGLSTAALYVTSGEVPRRAADRMDYDGDPANLARKISTEVDESVGSLDIIARDSTAVAATELADIFGEETVRFLAEQAAVDRQAEIDVLSQRLDELQARIEEMDREVRSASGTEGDLLTSQRDALVRQYGVVYEQYQQLAAAGGTPAQVSSLDSAVAERVDESGFQAPESPAGRAASASGLALIVGVLLVLVLERLDTKVRTKSDAERAFGKPVLAEVPRFRPPRGVDHPVLTHTDPMSAAAEAFRRVRAATLLVDRAGRNGSPEGGAGPRGPDADVQVIMVSSPGAGEGKTTLVANLAASFAETGRSVLVVGADLHRPEIHRYLDVGEHPGLNDLLKGDAAAKDVVDVVRTTSIPGVLLIASGTPTDTPTERPDVRGRILDACRSLADVVLIDTGPVLLANDAIQMAPEVDSILLVARAGMTSADAASRAAEQLERVHAPVTGVVLVAPKGGDGFTYAYEYGYYRRPEEPRSRLGRVLRRVKSWAMPQGRQESEEARPQRVTAPERPPVTVPGSAAKPRPPDRPATPRPRDPYRLDAREHNDDIARRYTDR